jgi:hypothetical protein
MPFTPHKPIIKRLPVRLTDFELLHYARENAKAADEMDGIELRKKQFSDECKAKIGGIAADIGRRNTAINTGEEPREVECYEEPSAKEGKVRVIRTDTHTVVETRPMRPEEYQTAIELFDREAE